MDVECEKMLLQQFVSTINHCAVQGITAITVKVFCDFLDEDAK